MNKNIKIILQYFKFMCYMVYLQFFNYIFEEAIEVNCYM